MDKNMEKEYLIAGRIIEAWDYDEERWYDAKVNKIEGDKIFLELTDERSEWQGLEWDEPIEELKWRKKK